MFSKRISNTSMDCQQIIRYYEIKFFIKKLTEVKTWILGLKYVPLEIERK